MRKHLVLFAIFHLIALSMVLSGMTAFADEEMAFWIETLSVTRERTEPDFTTGTGHLQSVKLKDGYSNAFPGLAEALELYNAEEKARFLEEFQDMCDMMDEHVLWTGQLKTDVQVRRADSDVFSFLEYIESFLGGAHGSYGYFGHNYDTRTGQEIMLGEIVTDKQSFYDAVCDQFARKYGQFSMDAIRSMVEGYPIDGESGNFDWIMETDGIRLIFGTYAIGSFADGVTHVCLKYDDYPELFTEQYQGSSDGWSIPESDWLKSESEDFR